MTRRRSLLPSLALILAIASAGALALAARGSLAVPTGAGGASASAQDSGITVEFLGWSHYRLTSPSGKVVVTNPFITNNPDAAVTLDEALAKRTDLIVVSDGHGDEVGDSPELAKGTGAVSVQARVQMPCSGLAPRAVTRYNRGMIETTPPRAPELWATLPAPDPALLEQLTTLRLENAALRMENAARRAESAVLRVDRPALQRRLIPLQARLGRLVRRGQENPDHKAAALCRELRKWWPALWTFARVDGVEPTNNVTERALRPAVLWRKGSFGSDSEAGSRFAERLLTVAATCRQPGWGLLDFLVATGEAALLGTAPLALLPTGQGAERLPGAMLVTPTGELRSWMETKGVPQSQLGQVNPGSFFKHDGITLQVVHSIHSSGARTPGEPLYYGGIAGSYMITFENGYTVYFSGSSAATMDMQMWADLYKPDMAIIHIAANHEPRDAAMIAKFMTNNNPNLKTVFPHHHRLQPQPGGVRPSDLRSAMDQMGLRLQFIDPDPLRPYVLTK